MCCFLRLCDHRSPGMDGCLYICMDVCGFPCCECLLQEGWCHDVPHYSAGSGIPVHNYAFTTQFQLKSAF